HQPESRMRETRPSGSEGGATEINRSFLPLSYLRLRRSIICDDSFRIATQMMDCEMKTMAGNFGANYTPAAIADVDGALPSKC
ncbi:MAG: hypothetical protein NT013_28475, partial [Planctomycetia bacterium]|nr:hypothetical protein [Planctomycetia bacterium]